jgi:hypothetical protein
LRDNTYSRVKKTSCDSIKYPGIDCQAGTEADGSKEEKDKIFAGGRRIPAQSSLANHDTPICKEQEHYGAAILAELSKLASALTRGRRGM